MVSGAKSFRSRALATAVACAFLVPAIADSRQGEPQFDRFIVRYKADAPERGNAAKRQQALDVAGRSLGVAVGHQRRLALGADLVRTNRKLDRAAAEALMLRLRRDPNVEFAMIDSRKKATLVPNDTHYAAYQWHYFDATSSIDAPAAWDIATGDGVVVAVLDTGIAAHPDLDPNIIAGYDFISTTSMANDGGGRDSNPADPGDWVTANECGYTHGASDSSWHGTHVAGTVAMVTNNSSGMAGVAYDSQVQPVRVLGKCGGDTSDIAEAIVWAAGGSVPGVPDNATPAQVINMSLGGGGSCDPLTQDAVDFAVSQGVVVVVAAGNDNENAANHSPASCRNVITVGAVGKTGKRASYSNYGAVVDVSAPGGDGMNSVWSTLNDGATAPGAPVYAGYQGTSMAAPHVAGVVALMQSYEVTSPALIETILKSTTRPFPAGAGCSGGCGTGLVDAPDALAAQVVPFLYIDDPAVTLEGHSGTKTVTFTVRLSRAHAADVNFNIATANGTATAGSDYVAKTSNSQTIPAGQLSKDFVVTINGDTTSEADETFVANVTGVTGIGAFDTQATATIVNDEVTGVLTRGVPLTGQSAATGVDKLYTLAVPAGATDLSFTLSGGNGGDADLYVKANMSPTQGADCASESPTSDEACAIADPDSGTWYVLVKGYSAYSNLTILADYTDGVVLPTLSINDQGIPEGDAGTSVATFTVKLSAASLTPVTFDIATANGTGAAGSDYVANSTTGVTFAPGQTSKTFQVTVNGDTSLEPNETVYANVTNASGATIADGQGRLNVLNDDGAFLRLTDVAVGEGDAGTKVVNITARLERTTDVPVTFNIATSNGTATAGTDYVAKSTTGVVIPAGTLAKSFSVTLNGDTTFEQNETFKVTISNAVNATLFNPQAIVTILNDEGPTISISDVGIVEGNSGTKIATFTVSLSQISASAVGFNIATAAGTASAGSDYVHQSIVGDSIAAGMLSKTFSVTVNGDTLKEPNELAYVNLSSVTNATVFDGQGRLNILNDDGPRLSIGNVSVTEDNAGTKLMVFTVTLSSATTVPVTYDIQTGDGTADAGVDYEASSLVSETIPAGMVSKTFSVVINGDTDVESDETLTATLFRSYGATIFDAQATGTITNDD